VFLNNSNELPAAPPWVESALFWNGSTRAATSLSHPLTASTAVTDRGACRLLPSPLHQVRLFVRVQAREEIERFARMYNAQEPKFVCQYFVLTKRGGSGRMLEKSAKLLGRYSLKFWDVVVAALMYYVNGHFPQGMNTI